MPFSNFMIRWLMISFYCSNSIIIFISKGIWPSVSTSSISLHEDNDDDQLHSTIFKTASKSKLFFWNCSLSKFLWHYRKDKTSFIHIALTTTRKVNFLLFALLMMIALCLVNCQFYTLDQYGDVLASISVLWCDSGMNSEGNFNIYLCPWNVLHLKIVEGTSLPASCFPFQLNSC